MNNPLASYAQFFEKPPSLAHLKADYLYNTINNKLPSRLLVQDPLEVAKLLPFLDEHFERILTDAAYHNSEFFENTYWMGKGKYSDVILELNELKHPGGGGHVVFFDDDEKLAASTGKSTCRVNLASSTFPILRELGNIFAEFVCKKSSKIYLLTNSYGEVGLQPLDIPPTDVDLALNYGSSFVDVHDSIIDALSNKVSGLYLFYGEPGTGKSSYIKYLLKTVTTRKIVYVPVSLIDSLVSPDFLPMLISNRNLVLVIEDAEKGLISREENTGNSSIVSAILNLTDSFIGNALNVSIIATFNTKKDNIDKALLRKGRLKLSHEFAKLNPSDAQALIDFLKVDYKATEEMSLAEIYHLHEDNRFKTDDDSSRVIGFGKS
jgi:hypothetical protein